MPLNRAAVALTRAAVALTRAAVALTRAAVALTRADVALTRADVALMSVVFPTPGARSMEQKRISFFVFRGQNGHCIAD